MLQQMTETHLNKNNKFPEDFKCLSLNAEFFKLPSKIQGFEAEPPDIYSK